MTVFGVPVMIVIRAFWSSYEPKMSAASGCSCWRAASAASAAWVRPREAAAAKFWIVGSTLVREVRPGRFCRLARTTPWLPSRKGLEGPCR